MGTAVVKTVTDKLEEIIAAHEAEHYSLISSQFVGGRDWVLFFCQMEMLELQGERIWPPGSGKVVVEEYGPDDRAIVDGAALPHETAGLVEDARRTWILYFGHNGRPTHLWLHRDADGGVIGQSIIPVGPADGVSTIPGAVPEAEFVDDPDPMVWAKAFASRFQVSRVDGTETDGDVAGLMVGWFSNFATAWERRVRSQIGSDVVSGR